MTVKIAVLTVARSDYSILKPILNKIHAEPKAELQLVVSGMHLSPEFGYTIDEIRSDGWIINAEIEHIISSDTAGGVAKSIGLGIIGFADFFSTNKPDFLLIVGDRAEMIAASLAAQPFELKIAHVHGGESTQGAIDEVFRHCITKMSTLHFATTRVYADRVIQLGECPTRVFNCGAPALDNLKTISFMSSFELQKAFGIDIKKRPVLVTFHPETYKSELNEKNLLEMLKALEDLENQIIFTSSNADIYGRKINQIINQWVDANENWLKINNMTVRGYYSLLKEASLMVGNSSSGIIEACSFNLPVVNIGDRQLGRVAGDNVIHVNNDFLNIKAGIKKALSFDFQKRTNSASNPYDNGGASKFIVETLCSEFASKLTAKKAFYDLPVTGI